MQVDLYPPVGMLLCWQCAWALCPGKLQKLPSSEIDFFLLSRQIFQDLTRKMIELWTVTCWAIWYARNKFLHEKVLTPPEQKMDMARCLLRDYQQINTGQSLAPSGVR
ncbi:hypothetical protein FCV25MIE_02336 [Fagus crenata]